jgi:hypothetical protein
MDAKSPEFLKAVQALRERALIETPELPTQLKNALDPQYWRELNPRMTVYGSEPGEAAEKTGVDPSTVEGPLQMLSTYGYFKMPPIVSAPAIEKMRTCFEVTRAAGWHPSFVFIYDEFWRAFRGPALVRFLTGALGRGYGQLPYCWGHYVLANSRGWRPHVDGPSTFNKLTVWLPLNDVTLENGCIYVVPRNAETEQISDGFWSKKNFDAADTLKLLQNSKALPAAAGSYLGWSPNVIHWGSTSGPLAPSRISISVEFASQPSNSLDDELPLLEAQPTAPLPSLSSRLNLIAKAIESYEHFFDPGLLPYLALAEQIIRHTTVESTCKPPGLRGSPQ